MAAVPAEAAPRRSLGAEALSAEDFETASIRSAAPSYISEAPSYHSTAPQTEPTPPYSPPSSSAANAPAPLATGNTPPRAVPGGFPQANTLPTLPTPSSDYARPSGGLPPVPTGPLPRRDIPSLDNFLRIPSWSTIHSNPTARHYRNVANRRLMSRSSYSSSSSSLLSSSSSYPFSSSSNPQSSTSSGPTSNWAGPSTSTTRLDRIDDEDEGVRSSRRRPLEDPYLVGEEAAARARRERLAREHLGEDVLYRENLRWDWFLGQLKSQ